MTTLAPPSPARVFQAVRTLPAGQPRLTLGWEILGWTRKYLLQPDGPDAGEPWMFTNEQAHNLLWWYAIDDRGRFLYQRGMYRRMKGHGKDPFAAALSAIEFVGPCRFSHFERGQPVGMPHSASWIQIAAVSKDQTRNTMTLFPGLLSPLLLDEYGIEKVNHEIIYAHGGRCRLEAVTSSPRALEGGRPTFTIKNESHHWIQANEGLAMADVVARNSAKSRDGSSRVLAISNAHAPGEKSDAERDYEAFRKSPHGFLYDSLEVEGADKVDLDDREAVLAALAICRGDSTWLDLERLLADIQWPGTPPNMARRYYLNQIAAAEERAFDFEQWRRLSQPHVVPPKTLITLGFDGSESRDHTALIGTEVESGYQWVVGYWEPRLTDDGEFRIDVDAVDAAVVAAFEQWDVWQMNCDPYYWSEWLSTWAGRYNRPSQKRVVSRSTTPSKSMAFALLSYRRAIDAGELTHDGSRAFNDSILNAHRHEQGFVDDNGERMWTIEKERPDSPFKIDAAMAGCLSWEARLAAVASGVLNKPEPWHGILLAPLPEPEG